MKPNLFTSLLLIIIVISCQDFVKSQSPPESIELKIQIDDGDIININLKPVETFLAYSYLVVKIMKDNEGRTFRDIGEETMNEMGEFTMYHDYCTKSAFVYFHKTQKLDGVIGAQYSIKGLPLNQANRVLRIRSKYLHRFHPDAYVKKTRFGRSIDDNSTNVRSLRDVGDNSQTVYYPELLVAVSYNIHEALGSRPVKTVSHILTVYNAVDMLYRLVQSVSIRINIAAILIEDAKDSLGKIGRPTHSRNSHPLAGFIGPSVYSRLILYFKNKVKDFPRDSYDFIVYNTRTPLRNLDEEDAYVYTFPAPRDYFFPPKGRSSRVSLSVRDFDTYESYINIAHGLAHVFTAKHDNHDSRNGDRRGCEVDRIMGESFCTISKTARNYCLEWSQETENDFLQFFTSRAGCTLLNEPRGRYRYQPRKIFTVEEQCQCFGFPTNDKEYGQRAIAQEKVCIALMQCIDDNGVKQKAPLPVDGTPCMPDSVCWAGRCTTLG